MTRRSITYFALVVMLLSLLVGNMGLTLAATGDPVLINEVLASHTGTDDTEFIELFGIPDTPLDGLSLIVVESDSGASQGQIDRRHDFGPLDTLGDNGFYLIGNPVGLALKYGVTPNFNVSDNYLENSSMTVALVETGSISGTTVSGSEVVLDSVALTDGGAGDSFFFGAPVIGPDGSYFPAGARRVADGVDTDAAADWVMSDFDLGPDNTPTAAPLPPPVEEACGGPFMPIYTIQGSGHASLFDGFELATEGVVVGDFQDGKDGFFIQDATGDGEVTTSDGIFVFSTSLDVNVGDLVRVRGTVDEFFGLTEITGVSAVVVCSTGNSVAPTSLSLPVASLDDFEPYEGMLVTLPQTLYISEFFNFDRFGEIVLTTERQFQATATYEPGSTEAADLAEANRLSRITLDDGRGSSNPDPAIHPNGNVFTMTNLFRGGDTVQNVTGVLDYNFGLYKVQPTQGADYTNANARPLEPQELSGELNEVTGNLLTVASFNVLNYFTTLDDGVNDICGPAGDQECRGADTAKEFTRQRDKIIAALAAIDADVVGLIEIENHPDDVPTADLVSGLNAVLGAGTYDYIATGAIGTDAIRQAFIYKPSSVSPVGDYAILDASVDPRFLDDYNRPVLAQTFMDNATGGVFTVAVNHLKSKGSDCDDIGDPDTGDGSGNCNLTRKAAAEALVDWLASDPTGSGDTDFLIIGDLNAYDKEDPIDVLLAGGYTDLLSHFIGEFAYSYVFDGQLGYLDHALASPDLMDEVTGATVWHINADEPDLIDYDMSFKKDAQDAIYAPDAYRSSDHDPVISGLDVCDEIPPEVEVTVTPDELWAPNHKYETVTVVVSATDNFDPDPVVTFGSVVSNEDDNGLGDGNTTDDIVIDDDTHFQLRAERSGKGDGRVYTITYQATDLCGNVGEGSATVTVSHDQGDKPKDQVPVPPGQDKDKGEDHDQGQGNDDDWVPPGQDKDQEQGDDNDQGQGNDEDWIPPGQDKDKDKNNNGKGKGLVE